MCPEQAIRYMERLMLTIKTNPYIRKEFFLRNVWLKQVEKYESTCPMWTAAGDLVNNPLAIELIGQDRLGRILCYHTHRTAAHALCQMVQHYLLDPVAHFPGHRYEPMEKILEIERCDICAEPIYIIIPWGCEDASEDIRGTILYNQKGGLDSWYVLYLRNQHALSELAQLRGMNGLLGPYNRPDLAEVSWLENLLNQEQPLIALKNH